MIKGKSPYILYLLFLSSVHGQTLYDSVYEQIQNNRYLLITTQPVVQYLPDMKSWQESSRMTAYNISLHLGNKEFEHEHYHHLSVYINTFQPKYTLKDGLIYYRENDTNYYEDDPEQYEYLEKFMPVFSNTLLKISCPTHIKSKVEEIMTFWAMIYHEKTLISQDYNSSYNSFLSSLQRTLSEVENEGCILLEEAQVSRY